MTKFIVSVIVTGLLAFACGLYLPWWSIALAAFIVAFFIHQPPLRSFLTGFVGVMLLWLVLILAINSGNQGILAPKMSMVMGFGDAYILVILSIFIGGLVAGFGSLTGCILRKIV
jgi:hypothetical protein